MQGNIHASMSVALTQWTMMITFNMLVSDCANRLKYITRCQNEEKTSKEDCLSISRGIKTSLTCMKTMPKERHESSKELDLGRGPKS